MFTVGKKAPLISQWHLVRSVWLCYDWKGVWITLSQGYLWSIINELISELAEDTAFLNVGGACPVNFMARMGQNVDSLLSTGTSSWPPVSTLSGSQSVSRLKTKQTHWLILVLDNSSIQARAKVQFSLYFGSCAFPWPTIVHFLCHCLPAADLESLSPHSHINKMCQVNNFSSFLALQLGIHI